MMHVFDLFGHECLDKSTFWFVFWQKIELKTKYSPINNLILSIIEVKMRKRCPRKKSRI